MTLAQLSKALTSIYNSLGNEWLTTNFVTEPFDFRVFVRKGDESDLTDYVVEVYTDRPVPKTLEYRDKESNVADGVHFSVIQYKFKEFTNYIDRFGDLGRTLGVQLMDLKPMD